MSNTLLLSTLIQVNKIKSTSNDNLDKNNRNSQGFYEERKKSKEKGMVDKAQLRMERKMEIKLVSQAAQNFNIHLHFRNLKKENQEYLDKLSSQV